MCICCNSCALLHSICLHNFHNNLSCPLATLMQPSINEMYNHGMLISKTIKRSLDNNVYFVPDGSLQPCLHYQLQNSTHIILINNFNMTFKKYVYDSKHLNCIEIINFVDITLLWSLNC